MKRKSYSELLKSPEWQKKRLEIFNRDNWRCKVCGSTDKELHVHHFSYDFNKKPWEYDNSLLITYCYSCHELEELMKKEFNSFISSGFTYSRIMSLLYSDINRIKSLKTINNTEIKIPSIKNLGNNDSK